ncbi:MAG: 1,4-dihydroxy-6-naphthoate synthase [Chitinophagaceae bacterium]|nr:1,4-dihydroxy-6-naphthoate synthase [Chitinophagaceae bacterium]MDB5221425.1 1,4-dihydroxy-6-naphthoate synthase [Chitinophagaceae bacterium]
MKLTLGFSPCPNDTFIFDALVNNKIDTGGLEFEVILDDVETLNRLALKNTLDISKISYGVLPLLLDKYVVLNSGSALGTAVGPLLIANKEISKEEIKNYTIAIPGEHTTAHMLFSLAFPEAKNKIFLRYDEIEDFVLSSKDKNAGGVIIHENRFTYQQKGLTKIIDLGEFWEQKTQSPIPLGGIVAKRNIDIILLKKIDGLIKQSIEYSFRNYPAITDYVRIHSQEMEEDIMRKHIDLYVNNYSINLGIKGENAISQMLDIYKGSQPEIKQDSIFLS